MIEIFRRRPADWLEIKKKTEKKKYRSDDGARNIFNLHVNRKRGNFFSETKKVEQILLPSCKSNKNVAGITRHEILLTLRKLWRRELLDERKEENKCLVEQVAPRYNEDVILSKVVHTAVIAEEWLILSAILPMARVEERSRKRMQRTNRRMKVTKRRGAKGNWI